MALLNLTTITQPFKWEQAIKYIKENNEIILDKKLDLLVYQIKLPVDATVTPEGEQSVEYQDTIVFQNTETKEMVYNPYYTLFTEDDLEIAIFDQDLNLIKE